MAIPSTAAETSLLCICIRCESLASLRTVPLSLRSPVTHTVAELKGDLRAEMLGRHVESVEVRDMTFIFTGRRLGDDEPLASIVSKLRDNDVHTFHLVLRSFVPLRKAPETVESTSQAAASNIASVSQNTEQLKSFIAPATLANANLSGEEQLSQQALFQSYYQTYYQYYLQMYMSQALQRSLAMHSPTLSPDPFAPSSLLFNSNVPAGAQAHLPHAQLPTQLAHPGAGLPNYAHVQYMPLQQPPQPQPRHNFTPQTAPAAQIPLEEQQQQLRQMLRTALSLSGSKQVYYGFLGSILKDKIIKRQQQNHPSHLLPKYQIHNHLSPRKILISMIPGTVPQDPAAAALINAQAAEEPENQGVW